MPLIKANTFVENDYAHVADDETLPDGAIVVSLKRFQAEREVLMQRNGALGIRIASHEVPDALGADVHHFAMVELEFPKFRDGRGYSSARTLRERMGFKGEIRATGDVLRDQWLFMRRCGVDAFEVRPGTHIEHFRAAMAEQTVFYQRSTDAHSSVFEMRHRSRAAAE